MIIASIHREGRGSGRRVALTFDLDVKLSISAPLAEERGLRPGVSLTQQDLAELQEEDSRRSAFEAAIRLLAYRPRSEGELRAALRKRSFTRAVIDDAIERLRGLGYIDDGAFARSYAESRQSARPRARWLLARELQSKGVDVEAIEAATVHLHDEEAAYEAATRRIRMLRDLEYPKYRERLGAFLTRRGFSYDIARQTIERCWSERDDPLT
jgi:regulatory protein